MKLGSLAGVVLMLMVSACTRSSRSGAASDARAPRASKRGTTAPDIPRVGPLAQRIQYEQAKSLLRAGKLARAVDLFRRAIATDPDGELVANCNLGLGSALGELGRGGEAVDAYRRVVELRPRDPEAFRALAIGLEDVGQLAEARQSLEQALALDPDLLAVYQDLAALHLKQKDIESAKNTYLKYELRRTYLIKTLGLSKDEQPRIDAARALGEARDEATAKALGLALTDRSGRVRLEVIRSLGKQALAEGVGPLKELLARTTDPEEKRQIQVSLDAIAEAAQPEPQAAPRITPKP